MLGFKLCTFAQPTLCQSNQCLMKNYLQLSVGFRLVLSWSLQLFDNILCGLAGESKKTFLNKYYKFHFLIIISSQAPFLSPLIRVHLLFYHGPGTWICSYNQDGKLHLLEQTEVTGSQSEVGLSVVNEQPQCWCWCKTCFKHAMSKHVVILESPVVSMS